MPSEIIHIIFAFFCLGFAGWFAETLHETIIRKKFVNKGFFTGPIVPCQGIGGISIYYIGSQIEEYPLLVFLSGVIIGTIVEYLTAVFLEKCFKVKCWDYRSYPHTRWCHYQGRICLTISLFFGVITLFVVYIYWKLIMRIADYTGSYLTFVVSLFLALFFADIFFSCVKVIKARKRGVPLSGYAVFSNSASSCKQTL